MVTFNWGVSMDFFLAMIICHIIWLTYRSYGAIKRLFDMHNVINYTFKNLDCEISEGIEIYNENTLELFNRIEKLEELQTQLHKKTNPND